MANNGIELIAAERARQVEMEGWTPEHDDGHFDESLALAASCYALPDGKRQKQLLDFTLIEWLWPWDFCWWKPAGRKTKPQRIRELVKAGALIAAEIDRLQRTKP